MVSGEDGNDYTLHDIDTEQFRSYLFTVVTVSGRLETEILESADGKYKIETFHLYDTVLINSE